MIHAQEIIKTCAVCGVAYTHAEFDRLMLCTSPSCPDGMLRYASRRVVLRQCRACPNTLAGQPGSIS